MDYRFKRTSRLLTPVQFKSVFQTGKRVRLGCITVITKNNGLGHARLGLTIAKRNVRHASDRNHLKRCLRESFRLRAHNLDNIDIVVMVTPNVNQLNKQQLWATIASFWDRLITK